MTETQLARLIAECRTRWDSIDKKFRMDAARPSGDHSPTLLECWSDALSSVNCDDALRVVRAIFAGDLKRPYDSDLPAAIRGEAKRLRNQAAPGSGALRQLKDDQLEIAADRAEQERLERQFGRVLDSMPLMDLITLANAEGPYLGSVVARDRHTVAFRHLLLDIVANAQSRKAVAA